MIAPLPAVAGFVAGPAIGYAISAVFCAVPAIDPNSSVAIAARRRCAQNTAVVLGAIALGSLLASRASADDATRSIGLGAALGSGLLAAASLAQIGPFALRPPIVTPTPTPTPDAPTPGDVTPQPTPTEPAPAAANVIGCTPLSGILPAGAVSQAQSLLTLDPNAADPRRRATEVSATTMRWLAGQLRYCGSGLGAQAQRDQLVEQLERRALEVEAALRARPPAFR